MVYAELHEVFLSSKLYTLINLEGGALIATMVVELNECLDALELWTLRYGGISKYLDGSSINNA